MTTIHPQVPVRHPRGDLVEIDAEIASLIADLWMLGIDTAMSCQDNGGGRVWIDFYDARQLEHFVRVVVSEREEGVESLFNRAVGSGFPVADWEAYRRDRKWRYGIQPYDVGADHDDPAPDFALPAWVRFPRSDLHVVAARVRQASEVDT